MIIPAGRLEVAPAQPHGLAHLAGVWRRGPYWPCGLALTPGQERPRDQGTFIGTPDGICGWDAPSRSEKWPGLTEEVYDVKVDNRHFPKEGTKQ